KALVELAAHGARDVGDDAVECLVTALVVVEAVMDQRAQQAARLRASIRVGPAHVHRRLAALEPRGAVAQRDRSEADHLGAGGGVSGVVEPALREATLQPHVARTRRRAAVLGARELPLPARK